MKGQVKISHFKFHAFRVNRDYVIDLETRFKIPIQTSLMLRQRPPKPYTLKIFYQFSDNCKIPSFSYHSKEAEMRITYVCSFLRVSQKVPRPVDHYSTSPSPLSPSQVQGNNVLHIQDKKYIYVSTKQDCKTNTYISTNRDF